MKTLTRFIIALLAILAISICPYTVIAEEPVAEFKPVVYEEPVVEKTQAPAEETQALVEEETTAVETRASEEENQVPAEEIQPPSEEAEPSEALSSEAMGAIANDIQSVDLSDQECTEPELVICPEPDPCPRCPVCPESVTLDSNAIILSDNIEAEASSALKVLREEAKALLKAKKADKNHVTTLISETEVFMDMYRELSLSAEALLIRADLYELNKLYEARLVALSKLFFEYPDSPLAGPALTGIRGLFTSSLKKAQKYDRGLTKGTSGSKQWADRYAKVIKLLHQIEGDKYLPSLMAEYDEFLTRYPRHDFADEVLIFKSVGFRQMKDSRSTAYTLKWLITLYPESSSRSAALNDLAFIYEDNLKQYQKASETYELLVSDYPDGKQTLTAYQRLAVIYDKQLKNPTAAIGSLEAIVTKYPEDPASLEAFTYMSRLQVSQKLFADSVKTLNRLADMFKGSDEAVDALEEAAKTASGKLKDYELQVKVQHRLVDEYPDREEAVIALDAIAATNVKYLDNKTESINTYKTLIKKYPGHKLAKAAIKKVDKLLSQ